jgi:hypothetical protein
MKFLISVTLTCDHILMSNNERNEKLLLMKKEVLEYEDASPIAYMHILHKCIYR